MLRPLGVVLAAICIFALVPAAALADGEPSEASEDAAEAEAPAPEATPSEPAGEPATAEPAEEPAAPEATPEIDAEPAPEAEAEKEDEGESEKEPETEAAETATAAASESSKGEAVAVETIEATVDVPPAVEETEVAETEAEEAPKKPWSASVAHSFGWGLQADDTTGYSHGSLSASGRYQILDKVNATAGLGMRYTVDQTPNDGVRADLGGISLGLSHASLYKDEAYTGLNLTGGITFSQSLAMGTLTLGRGPTLALSFGASRKVGPVSLSYGLGFSKFFPVDAVTLNRNCSEEQPEETCLLGNANNFGISNNLSAGYSPREDISLAASFSWNSSRHFGPTQPTAQSAEGLDPTGWRPSYGFSLSGTWTTPVEGLSAGLSFSNARPIRSADQTVVVADFSHGVGMIFDARYAAMSFDLSYSF